MQVHHFNDGRVAAYESIGRKKFCRIESKTFERRISGKTIAAAVYCSPDRTVVISSENNIAIDGAKESRIPPDRGGTADRLPGCAFIGRAENSGSDRLRKHGFRGQTDRPAKIENPLF